MNNEQQILAIDIRPAVGDDVPWVFSSWIKSYRQHGPREAQGPRQHYYADKTRGITRVTGTPGVVTLVACNPDNEQQIFGWACGRYWQEDDTLDLHYIHVKSIYRRAGVARALVSALGLSLDTKVRFTHTTAVDGASLRDWVPKSWAYRPNLF